MIAFEEEPPPQDDRDAPPLYLIENPHPSVTRIAAMAASAAAITAPLFVPVDHFFASCGREVPYLLKPFLIQRGFVLVSGANKHGKTWFMGYLAGECAARGLTVMFVEEEGSAETTRDRLQPFVRDGARLHISHRKGWRLDDERSVNRLIEEIKAVGAQVLCADPANMLHAHMRGNGEVPAEVLLSINRIINETGCTIVLALHTRKGESHDKNSKAEAQTMDIAGSYAWGAAADNVIQIRAVPNKDRVPGEVRIRIENPDTRNGEPFAPMTAIIKPGPYRADSIIFDKQESATAATLRKLLPLIPRLPGTDTIRVEDLRAAARIGMKACRAAVALGESEGTILRKKRKLGGLYRPDDRGLSVDAFSSRTESAVRQDEQLEGPSNEK
jgi:KaiC/GvpD/RAD55 family RecA-like ATPase